MICPEENKNRKKERKEEEKEEEIKWDGQDCGQES